MGILRRFTSRRKMIGVAAVAVPMAWCTVEACRRWEHGRRTPERHGTIAKVAPTVPAAIELVNPGERPPEIRTPAPLHPIDALLPGDGRQDLMTPYDRWMEIDRRYQGDPEVRSRLARLAAGEIRLGRY